MHAVDLSGPGLVVDGIAAFRGERLVLRDVSFAVPPGGAAVLLGANGAGKSTLLRVLAGLKRADAGVVRWRGGSAGEDVAYLGHLDAVKPGLTVRENLAFPPPRGPLDVLGLAALMEVPGRLLSAGQKRRVALARVAACGAGLWLLDEPTLGLDAESVAGLGAVIAAHRGRGGVVVAATHLALPMEDAVEVRLFAPVLARGQGVS